MDLYAKMFLYNEIFYHILMLFKFLKISYVPLLIVKSNTKPWFFINVLTLGFLKVVFYEEGDQFDPLSNFKKK